jgi:phage N-6-adenine-methyltransferase
VTLLDQLAEEMRRHWQAYRLELRQSRHWDLQHSDRRDSFMHGFAARIAKRLTENAHVDPALHVAVDAAFHRLQLGPMSPPKSHAKRHPQAVTAGAMAAEQVSLPLVEGTRSDTGEAPQRGSDGAAVGGMKGEHPIDNPSEELEYLRRRVAQLEAAAVLAPQTRPIRPLKDEVFTSSALARRLVEYFKPAGRMLDPCRGPGAFFEAMCAQKSGTVDWCEIAEGRDFLEYDEEVDWVMSNPPWSSKAYRAFVERACRLSQNVVYLVRLHNALGTSARHLDFLQHGHALKEIIIIGWREAGIPGEGFVLAAFHWQKGWAGGTTWTYWDDRLPVMGATPDAGVTTLKAELEAARAKIAELGDRLSKAKFGSYGRGSPETGTPKWLWKAIDAEFHPTWDVAASERLHLTDNYYTKERDALLQDWEPGAVLFCNPPYNGILPFFAKGWDHVQKHGGMILFVVPLWRDASWWNFARNGEIRILGRIPFEGHTQVMLAQIMVVILTKDSQIRPDGSLYVRDNYYQQPKKTRRKKKAAPSS